MMEDETARIRALGEIAAEFDLDAIRVRTGEIEIEIVRRDPAAAAQPVIYAAPPAGTASAAAAAPAGAATPDAAAATTMPRGARAVTAPVVGVFYRAASPGAEPFIEVGSRVAVGDPLCILEAMKLMNEINSEFAGTVLRVLPDNGELVTLGQELVWIEA